jgi:hypothetical protein
MSLLARNERSARPTMSRMITVMSCPLEAEAQFTQQRRLRGGVGRNPATAAPRKLEPGYRVACHEINSPREITRRHRASRSSRLPQPA